MPNIKKLFCFAQVGVLATGILTLGATADAAAVDFTIEAEYRADIRNPGNLEFTNKTPNSGRCNYGDINCAELGIHSLATYISGTKRPVTHESYRSRMYFKLGPPKILTVTNEAGQHFNLSIRVRGLNQKYSTPNTGAERWADWWNSGPCTRLWSFAFNDTPEQQFGMFLVRNDGGDGAAECYNDGIHVDVGEAKIDDIDFAYSLTTPSVLALPSGVYTGVTSFSIGGNGMDIDLGDGVSLSQDIINLNFVLTVTHDFRVDFPEISHALLTPPGGWQQWTAYGRAPSRLQQELPFTLTSSSDFSVKMRCEHEVAGRCGIEDLSAGTVVPVDVDVTMPGMSVQGSGTPALNTALVSEASGTTAPRFTPDGYLVSRPSKLTFSANGASVTEMLKAPSSRWQGDVTVVFDSDP